MLQKNILISCDFAKKSQSFNFFFNPSYCSVIREYIVGIISNCLSEWRNEYLTELSTYCPSHLKNDNNVILYFKVYFPK